MLKKIFLILLLAISLNHYCLPVYPNELSSPKSIDLILEAENTTKNPKTEELKYYLPEEIIPEYIEGNNGFSIELDISKGRYYLKKNVTFAPGEVLRFYFKVKNIWTISCKELSSYLEEAKILCDTLANKSVADKAEGLYKSIEQRYNEIVATQDKADSVKDHIEQFRVNKEKVEEIVSMIDKLRNLQPLRKIGDVDIKIAKGKIGAIILMVVGFICIISFLTWKIWRKTR